MLNFGVRYDPPTIFDLSPLCCSPWDTDWKPILLSDTGWKPMLVRLRVRTNSGVEVPIGQNTGCP
jgi:hypothetical protein